MTGERDYYKVLQVDPQADDDVITAAFRTLARRLHPDKDITGVHEVRMAELNRAYTVLRDPSRRRQYDSERILEMRAMGPGMDAAASAARPGGLAARWNQAAARHDGSGPAGGAPEGTVLNFGRYAGMTLQQIAGRDTNYLRWLGRHSSGLRYRREIEQILRESLEPGFASRTSG
jgi:curved DNA-binding protein CbpA